MNIATVHTVRLKTTFRLSVAMLVSHGILLLATLTLTLTKYIGILPFHSFDITIDIIIVEYLTTQLYK